MKYLIVNAYPRSGSVFFASMIERYITGADVTYASLHIPYILGNQDLYTATVVRDPYEAISSHMYMKFADFWLDDQHREATLKTFYNTLEMVTKDYMVYMDLTYENRDKPYLHIVDFKKMEADPVNEAINVFTKFNLDRKMYLNDDNDLVVEEIRSRFSNYRLLNDSDGHMPRDKSDTRLYIEELVRDSDILKEAYEKYLNVSKYFS